MPRNHPPQPTSDALAWQADRFLLAELTAAEQAEFAELLATDAAARQALAEETQLLASLAQLAEADFATPELVRPAEKRVSTPAMSAGNAPRWTWAVSGLLAASLLLTAMLVHPRPSQQPASPHTGLAQHTGSADQLRLLVNLWTQGLPLEDGLAAWEPSAELLAEEDSEPAASDGNGPEAALAPDWMFAAVVAESAAAGKAPSENEQWQ